MPDENEFTEAELRVDRDADRALKKLVHKFNRDLENRLRKDRPKLFKALGEFANIRSDDEAWFHFRSRWPRFFPQPEYEKAQKGLPESVRNYPFWLRQVWDGDTAPLLPLLGVKADTPFQDERPRVSGIYRIPACFYPDWDEGILRYQSGCDFQRALDLLFRESWRARTCGNCVNKFIARRVAQKYCTTDCSERVQHELKLKWWAEHGETWRRKRKAPKSRGKEDQNGTRKTR
jgi:hypothetical protein